MVPRKPPTQKFIEYLRGLDESFAFRAAVPIFECCRAYRQDFGYLDAEIVHTVATKLAMDERMTLICSQWPTLFHTVRSLRRNGRIGQIRVSLPKEDRIGFDAFLTMNQLRRLGGHATASQLQRVMSGCHGILAENQKKALVALEALGLIAKEQIPSGQWWNPRRHYYLNDIPTPSSEAEDERMQTYRVKGREMNGENQPFSPQLKQELTRSA